jgi:hypothetical protein
MSKSKRASAQKVTPHLKLATVTPIRRHSPYAANIRQDCVDKLRNLLRMAESGELVGIVFIATLDHGALGHTVDMGCRGLADENVLYTLGTMAALTHDLMEKEKEIHQ